jgi:hypothetical protein
VNLLDFSNYPVDFQDPRASGVIRLAEKRLSAMTDERRPYVITAPWTWHCPI